MELIANHAWHLKKEGYRESTIRSRVSALKGLARVATLKDPESVKEAIAKLSVSEGRKELLVYAYAIFSKQQGIVFGSYPRYRRVEKLPFVPLEVELDQLIAGLGKRYAVFLQSLKETGARPGEIWSLKWCDIDLEKQAVNLTPEKNSLPRQMKVSSKLLAMLLSLPRKNVLVFGGGDLNDFSRWFSYKRKLIAEKLNNPRIIEISFKTFRHWFASRLYFRTRDVLAVQHALGHRNLKNTLVYTHLVDFKDDDFNCRTARTLLEAKELIESGFEYVTEIDGVKLFRKRK